MHRLAESYPSEAVMVDCIKTIQQQTSGISWMHPQAYDATMVMMVADETGWHVAGMGDGCVMAQRRDGDWKHAVIHDGTHPRYGSYLLDPGRMSGIEHLPLRAIHGNMECDISGYAWSWHGSREAISGVWIATDGVLQVTEHGIQVPWVDQLHATLAFPQRQGAYLQRRMRRWLKDKRPHDDLTIAGIMEDMP
jgi:hypothetical protein